MAVISIRFAVAAHHDHLKAAAAQRGVALSPLAEELIEEGLRMREHPQVIFRDGEAGRRPALTCGPEIAEVIGAIIGGDIPLSERRGHAAELLSIPASAVDAALDYYVAYTDDVDAELAERARIADEMEARWRRGQQLLAT